MAHRCYIVPPHLLKAISESSHNSDSIRQAARSALIARETLAAKRRLHIESVVQSRRTSRAPPPTSPFVPASVLRSLSQSEHVDEEARARAAKDLEHALYLESRAKEGGEAAQAQLDADPVKSTTKRSIYDAGHTSSESKLPGKLVRGEGNKEAQDKSVNEAYDNVGTVLQFYKDKFKWISIDNKNSDVISSVHFGEMYENAFWDTEERQMVFGDGGEFLSNFVGAIDVIGHELTHAVTEHTSPLNYQGQPGALNEHVSDVFGIMIKQKVQNETAASADWLIGEDCILPGVKGVALRSMKAPGTAYNDPRFGKDPQVDNMKDYTTTFEDNGGVHIFSGIPNKAFYLAAKAFGGYSWEKAGQIWWKTMRSGQVSENSTFLQFADATVDTAKKEFGTDAAKTVRKAWDDVGQEGSCQSPDLPVGKPDTPKHNDIRLRYQLSLPTLRALSTIEKAPDRRKVLETACHAAEFRSFPIKQDQKNLFREINDHTGIPYPINGLVTDPWQKVFLLIQIDLSRAGWPNKISANGRKELMRESGRIYVVLDRVLRCLADMFGEREDGRGVTVTLDVLRSVKAKVWEGTEMELLQVEGIGAAKMKRLTDAGIKTIKQLAGLEFYHIERLLSRNPPFGHQLLTQLSGFPLLHMQLSVISEYVSAQHDKHGKQDTAASVLQQPWITRVLLGYSNDTLPTWCKRNPWATLVIEGDDGRLLWFWRGSVKRIEATKVMFVRLDARKGESIKATFACEGIVGTLIRTILVI
ncbi:matellopeptidase-like protein [Trichoderma citrinoviride]|uniref:Matellopeptidase-like protein n=1 Tax=Trichoderma citrinoviride TaxID=58853 RepID=A0A2T4B5K7_9HYPO|nr:matellopeptidase-like protein [Trichoderma citrinoviride]PTB64580.1 matellopeptidase-like protein [Trichoderma citrinoviride]